MIRILKQHLQEGLRGLGKIVSTKASLPILQSVRIKADTGVISLIGTNLDEWLEYRIAAEVAEPADWIIELAKLREFLVGNGKYMLEMEPAADNAIKISFDKAGVRAGRVFATMPLDEWPVFPDWPQELKPVKADLFAAIRDAIPSAAKDRSRRILNAVLLNPENVLATDARHLVRLNCSAPIDEPVIVPVTKTLASGLLNMDGQMAVTGKDNVLQIHFASGPWRYTVRNVEGSYPNYMHVIPGDDRPGIKVRFNEADVESLSKALPAFEVGDEFNGVALYTGKLGVKFMTVKPGGTAALDTQAVSEGALEHSVSVFDRNFMLRAFGLGMAEFRFGTGYQPVVASGARGILVFAPIRNQQVCEYYKRLGLEYKPIQEDTKMKKNETGAPQAPQQAAGQAQGQQAGAQQQDQQPPKPETAASLKMVGSNGNGANGVNGSVHADPFEELQKAVAETRNQAKALTDSLGGLQKKIAEAQKAVKLRERDFRSAKELLSKLKTAANF